MASRHTIQLEQFRRFNEQVMVDTLLGQFTHKFHYQSMRDIQEEYGLSCAKIFSLLFIKWQKGGRNLKGKAYKSIWKLDNEAAKIYQDIKHKFKNEDKTGKEILEELQKFDIKKKERVKIWDDDFTIATVDVYSGDELKEVKQLKKDTSNRDKWREEKQRREALR